MTSILLWAQGNLMVWEYGLLDGRSIDWTKDTWRGWLDFSIWVGGFITAMVTGSRARWLGNPRRSGHFCTSAKPYPIYSKSKLFCI